MPKTWPDILFGNLKKSFLYNFLWDDDYCSHCEMYHGRDSTFDPDCAACQAAADDGEFSTCTAHADECTAFVENPEEWGYESCGCHLNDCRCGDCELNVDGSGYCYNPQCDRCNG